jgi:signal transduction histidine kinase
VAGFEQAASRRGLTLSVRVPRGRVAFVCDGVRLTQALTNLIDNAIKFSPKSSSIVVCMRCDGEQAMFTVTNRGTPIAEEHRALIFERRWQVPGETRGFGIGLYVTRKVVELHGGRIWVEDAAGGGTTFAFILPRAAGANGHVLTAVPEQGCAARQEGGR